MQDSGSQRAIPCAFSVSAVLWFPLLALDLGYPSLSQVVTTSVLWRTAGYAFGVCLAVALALAFGAGLVARRLAHRLGVPGMAAAVAFCGTAAGSAALVFFVARLRTLGGPAGSPLVDLALLAMALLAAVLLGRLVAAGALLAARRLRKNALPLFIGALAAAVWALQTGALLEASEARDLSFVPGLIAAGAVLAGVRCRLAGRRQLAALVVAFAMAGAGSLPAVRLRPAQPPPLPPTSAIAAAADAPHVVVVMIDTWRWDATDLATGGLGTTPILAALAAQGSTVFPATAAPAPSTLPSVKALITGRPASHFGIPWWGDRPPPADAWTLARAFRAAGYATCGFTANGIVKGAGFESGFDAYWAVSGLASVRRSFFLNGLLSRGHYWHVVALADAIHAHKTRGDSVVDGFEGWLDRRSAAGPLFAYLHIVEPHSPYRDRGHGLIPDSLRDLPQRYSHSLLRQLPLGDPGNARYRETPAMQEIRGRYHEEVRDADRILGRIVDALSDRGLLDDTLLVIVGDHGEEFMEHDGFGHGHDVFEELVHVPLVLRWPRREAFAELPAELTHPVSLLDVFPTLTDLLGLPPAPEPFVGRSLRAALAGRAAPVAATSEAIFRNQIRLSYRLENLKARLVFDDPRRLPSEAGQVTVFDLEADPGETAAVDGGEREVAEFLERAKRELDASWGEAIEATVSALGRLPAPSDQEQEEDEALERLRALGYLN